MNPLKLECFLNGHTFIWKDIRNHTHAKCINCDVKVFIPHLDKQLVISCKMLKQFQNLHIYFVYDGELYYNHNRSMHDYKSNKLKKHQYEA